MQLNKESEDLVRKWAKRHKREPAEVANYFIKVAYGRLGATEKYTETHKDGPAKKAEKSPKIAKKTAKKAA